MDMGPKITLDEGLDLRQVQSTGSVLLINSIYDEAEATITDEPDTNFDIIGKPIADFKALEKTMTTIDSNGFVKKLILEEGGGLPVGENCTVFVSYSAYWENENEPFDVRTGRKHLEVDLKDNGILPGLEMAIKTMCVGETSVFLLSHKVMYGELGIPPRIKPAAQCAFYIRLHKSILTPKEGKLCLSEPNMFQRVRKEVIKLFHIGEIFYKCKNYKQAVNVFKKAVAMLHKCRLADEKEERIQENYLKKLYYDKALCYNKLKMPEKACTACNELNRLNCLWSNGKALLQNAIALRMIGEYNNAEKRLKKATRLIPENNELQAELKLLQSIRESDNRSKLVSEILDRRDVIHEKFKEEVDRFIKYFKENDNLCQQQLPQSLNACEQEYIKQACIRENLFYKIMPKEDFKTVAENNIETASAKSEEFVHNFVLCKEDIQSDCDIRNAQTERTLDEEILKEIELLMSKPMIISTQK